MPVTTKPSPSKVGKNGGREIPSDADSATVLNALTFDFSSPYEGHPQRPKHLNNLNNLNNSFRGLPIIASSIDPRSTVNTEFTKNPVLAHKNGFVGGLIRAFNQDLHLIIRPDDVWQAILSQFSLFVNGNAERLRHMFVTHEGKRNLTIDFTPMRISDLDFGKVAQEFASFIQENVVDAELRQWMIPDFSTTTNHDKAVAAFGMMGAMRQYFKPDVRVDRLHKYGEECKRWASLLKPVMRYMLRTFDEPESQEVKNFWLRVAYEAGSEGSSPGVRTLSGWITAFAYFRDNGSATIDWKEEEICRRERASIQFGTQQELIDRKRLILDGVSYPLIRQALIPMSIALLPMTIIDTEVGVQRFVTAVSGTIGMSISANGTTAQPVSAWWVVEEFVEPMKSTTTKSA
ncbi:hypothetical protein NUW58_g7400 [Xylaria curta]|uniref:Uncharacterized protein n=1 Tax=Xylaria curta TaxID=42375 RepID=A0ACC1NI56_9PEZI|nr:hypothetical protein NUW58_g7400 [Xylaria curta]